MKKIFTLITVMLIAVSTNAQTRRTLWEGSLTMDNSWPSVQISKNDLLPYKTGDALIITISSADNTINTGWQWGPQVFVNCDWKTLFGAKTLTNGETNIEVVFTLSDEEVSQINGGSEIEVQGMNVVVTKVELEENETIEYETTGTELEMDSYGQIYKDQLTDYSGKDKLVFTYKVEGSTDYTEGEESGSVIGWGIGAIRSLGGNVEVASIGVKGIGEYNIQFTMDDLQGAIEDTNTTYNTNGIAFAMWNCKNAIGSRVSIVAYKAVSTGIEKVVSETGNVNAPIYNLAGQRVNASYKGVVIQNGKKFFQK